MSVNYDRWLELSARMSHSRNPFMFWPKIDGLKDRKTEPGWSELGMSHEAIRRVVEEFLTESNRIKANENLSDVGRDRKLKEAYETAKKIASKLSETVLAQGKQTAFETQTAAENKAFDTPKDPYRIALEMESLRALRQLNLRKKGPTMIELEAMPLEVRRAVALAPRLASGVTEFNHEHVKRSFAGESGGFELSEASALSDAAAKVSEAFEMAEVTLDQAAGLKPSHPLAEMGRQALSSQGIAEAEREEVIHVVEPEVAN